MEAHLSIVHGYADAAVMKHLPPGFFFLVTYWGLQKHEGRNIGYLFSLYLKSQMCSTKQPSQTLLDEIKKYEFIKQVNNLLLMF